VIATLLALPITVVLAFVFTAGHPTSTSKPTDPNAAGVLPAVKVAAPPAPTEAISAACVKLFSGLPVQLGTLNPRKTDTDSSFVAAWGNPAIVIRCGVTKPTIFNTPAAAQPVDVSGVLWQPDPQKSQTVYTAVDRSVYIEVTVPAGQDQPLPDLAKAIEQLPQLCSATDAAGNSSNPKLPVC
jgi:hypothetical protein